MTLMSRLSVYIRERFATPQLYIPLALVYIRHSLRISDICVDDERSLGWGPAGTGVGTGATGPLKGPQIEAEAKACIVQLSPSRESRYVRARACFCRSGMVSPWKPTDLPDPLDTPLGRAYLGVVGPHAHHGGTHHVEQK